MICAKEPFKYYDTYILQKYNWLLHIDSSLCGDENYIRIRLSHQSEKLQGGRQHTATTDGRSPEMVDGDD